MKPMSEKPTVRGDYCFMSIHCMSIMPVYASFDGENWVGDAPDTDYEGLYYIDYAYPFGSQNTEYAEPEVDNSLAGRLARYKATK